MSESQAPKVIRFCPECGKKFGGAESVFAEPRICPSCKTRVIFLDYPRDVPVGAAPATEELQKRDPVINRNLSIVIASSIAGLLLMGIIALVTGQLTILFGIACVILVAGIICMSVYLENQSRANALAIAFQEQQERLRFHEKNQTRLVQHVHGLQTNFEVLVQEERNALKQQHASLLQDAADNRQRTAEERELATKEKEQYGGAADAMCKRLLMEVRKSVKSKLTPNNFATQKERFMNTVAFCEKKGYPVDRATIDAFVAELKRDFEEAVRKQAAKDEQARIKERIREEQRAERELERELRTIEAEENAIENAIAEAIARTHDEHSAEVEELRRRLADAEQRAERAKSMAQLTKAGNVYVISNVGSFGEDVFKIGMTRRLEPMDRVRELGDASVPFPFDVHMIISCDDAPALETKLHQMFASNRVNRVNLRKEFFKVSIDEIVSAVENCHGSVDYIAEPEALEYNESLKISDEDFEFISSKVPIEQLAED